MPGGSLLRKKRLIKKRRSYMLNFKGFGFDIAEKFGAVIGMQVVMRMPCEKFKVVYSARIPDFFILGYDSWKALCRTDHSF